MRKNHVDQIERYRGSLLGLATGDALGASLEGLPPGSFSPVKDMTGGGSHGLPPGYWTDDTSMALCLAESLTERGFDSVDQIERYLRWFREGYLSSTGECFGIGNTTRGAILRFEETREPYCGPAGLETAGNGSIMRLTPVPAVLRLPPGGGYRTLCGEFPYYPRSDDRHGRLPVLRRSSGQCGQRCE